MPDARSARSLACRKNTRVSHHGHTGNTRHSPRNGFNGFLRDLLGDRLVFHRRQRIRFRELDASAGASGPHDLKSSRFFGLLKTAKAPENKGFFSIYAERTKGPPKP